VACCSNFAEIMYQVFRVQIPNKVSLRSDTVKNYYNTHVLILEIIEICGSEAERLKNGFIELKRYRLD